MIAYGARCSWWDDKRKVGTKDGTRTGLPCCPICKGVLFEQEDEQWWNGVDARTLMVDPHYREFIEWSRGKCYPGYPAAYAAWEATK